MTLVVDSSMVAMTLLDDGPTGEWASQLVRDHDLAAPHHLLLEIARVLRRAELDGLVTADMAAAAHDRVLDLDVQLFPYEPVGRRVWDLRNTVSTYDAWYVALAEALEVPFATIDLRLVRAPGPRCRFLTPPA